MTTDPFTDAAEDRVDELWPYAPAGFSLPPARRMDRRIGFRLGAQWARAHLAAQEPTDYQIDVAMDAYAEASGQSVSRPWMEAALDAYESAARRYERASRDALQRHHLPHL